MYKVYIRTGSRSAENFFFRHVRYFVYAVRLRQTRYVRILTEYRFDGRPPATRKLYKNYEEEKVTYVRYTRSAGIPYIHLSFGKSVRVPPPRNNIYPGKYPRDISRRAKQFAPNVVVGDDEVGSGANRPLSRASPVTVTLQSLSDCRSPWNTRGKEFSPEGRGGAIGRGEEGRETSYFFSTLAHTRRELKGREVPSTSLSPRRSPLRRYPTSVGAAQ